MIFYYFCDGNMFSMFKYNFSNFSGIFNSVLIFLINFYLLYLVNCIINYRKMVKMFYQLENVSKIILDLI